MISITPFDARPLVNTLASLAQTAGFRLSLVAGSGSGEGTRSASKRRESVFRSPSKSSRKCPCAHGCEPHLVIEWWNFCGAPAQQADAAR